MSEELGLNRKVLTPVARLKQRSSIFSSAGRVRGAFKSPVRNSVGTEKSDSQKATTAKHLKFDEVNKDCEKEILESAQIYKKRKINTGKFKTPTKSLENCLEKKSDRPTLQNLTLKATNLENQLKYINQEIAQLYDQGHKENDLPKYINVIHEYNEIRDITQRVLGELAVNLRVTTTSLYRQFGLDIDN